MTVDYQLMQGPQLRALARTRGIEVGKNTLLIDLVKQLEAQDNPPAPVSLNVEELYYLIGDVPFDATLVFQNRETGEIFTIDEIAYEPSDTGLTVFIRGETL